MKEAVIAKDLRKTFEVRSGRWFARKSRTVVAVDSISFSVPEGQSVAFIGPNGAGKSTTIKLLTGIMTPTSGSATVLGLTPWSKRGKLASQIGAVFGQRSQLWLHLPPNETFNLLATIYSLSDSDFKRQRDELVDRFDLGSFLDTPVRKLSLGQRMRCEIAASLLHKPRLVFLDEPTIGVDVVARRELRDLIRQWNREEGLTVFLTSHDAGDIESVSDRVIVVNHGRIAIDGDVSDIKRDVLTSRVVDVKFKDVHEWLPLPGSTVISSSQYELRVEVDTRVTRVEAVVASLLGSAPVADISIETPPLEDVIAHLFTEKDERALSGAVENENSNEFGLDAVENTDLEKEVKT